MIKLKRSTGPIFLVLLLLITSSVYAQKPDPVARLQEVAGEVIVKSSDKTGPGSSGQDLLAGDIVKTGPTGQAVLRHKFGFTSTLGPNSTLRVSAALFDIAGLILVRGWLQIKGYLETKTRDYRVTTPVATLGVRGTGFIVVGANDGSSIVAVDEGLVTAGIGQDFIVVSAGYKVEGQLTEGYGPLASGEITKDQAEDWRIKKEEDLESRLQKVLAELARLQKQEDADWQEIQKEVMQASQRIVQARMSSHDRFFFRRVFDIEDRMGARRLLAIDLREWAGITPNAEAEKERVRLQKEWEARDWRRKAWEDVSKGKIPTQPQPENIRRSYERMQKDIEKLPREMPKTIPVRPDTAGLFPDVVKGVYLGMTPPELANIRPNATTNIPPGMPTTGDMPVVYTEKQLSGGDWSVEGWFTGMYTFYKGKMVQGTFTAFSGTEKLRAQLLEKFIGLYGKPGHYRVEPDWAQPGVNKGSTVEWQGEGVEVILVSRFVPTVRGNVRGLELRIRLAGFDEILESAGQFSAPTSVAQDQTKVDFPELDSILSR